MKWLIVPGRWVRLKRHPEAECMLVEEHRFDGCVVCSWGNGNTAGFDCAILEEAYVTEERHSGRA